MTPMLCVLMRSIAAAFLLAAAWQGHLLRHKRQASIRSGRAAEFSEPVTLSSVDGVLEVRLTAHQGEVRLDTVAVPVKNTLLFGYKLNRGKASNGVTEAANSYPAPTLQVFPGERLIVHLENALTGLTIRDLLRPEIHADGEEVPLYPPQLTESPLNLHTHGLHVSPKGNSDNVLLHMPPGTENTYIYDVPPTCRRAPTGTTRTSTR